MHFILCIFTIFCTWNITHCFTYTPVTKYQWKIIANTLQKPIICETSKKYIIDFLYKRFQPLVFSHFHYFYRFHKNKCKHISYEELLSYGQMGLYIACTKYHGNSSFTKYASTYIQGALYNCMTKNHPISKIPAWVRRRKNIQPKKYSYEIVGYVQPNLYLGTCNYIKSTTLVPSYKNHDMYKEMWNKINTHPNIIVRRIFHYKFDYYFNVIRSNKHISFLMCCTEENIRKHVSKNIMWLVYNNTKKSY